MIETIDTAELARLRRRLARERAIRREAEAISERVTRDLYDRRAEAELLALVARAANLAGNAKEAARVALDAVCAHTGWPVGHMYLAAPDGSGEMVPSDIWHLSDAARFAEFREVTMATILAPGVGLPGRVAEARAPAWIRDVGSDSNFSRAEVARALGVRAGFATPVRVGVEVVAVFEFFTAALAEPQPGLLEVTENVGTLIGRVFERDRAEAERSRLGQQQQAILESAGEGIIGLDIRGAIRFVNPAAARMLGWEATELRGRPLHEIVHGEQVTGSAHDADACPIAGAERTAGVSRSDEDLFTRRDGSVVPVEYIRTAMREEDRVSGSVLTFKDTTERKRFETQLTYLAEHDALTGLLNRRRFEDELARQVALSRRYGGGAVLLLDLDNFKYVNDTLGHHAGDELIRSVAGVLRDSVRDTDILARLGGDEFAILLPHASPERAAEMAARLISAVRAHTVVAAERPIRITTSVGVTNLGEADLTAEEVLVESDIAMYEAKEAGRDRHAVYTHEVGQRTHRRAGMPWTDRIRHALDHDGLLLYGQPILDLRTGAISHYELLLRMRGEQEGQVVLPGAFLPPAERFGLIREIDRWVVREAIALASRLEMRGDRPELFLEINLSGRSIGDPDLPRMIKEDLATWGVDPSRLIFEITETAAISNMEEAAHFARELTHLGCRFALDDFGAGFGSFYYLKYLPLDYLKIDGDFIEALATSAVDQRMVHAMVEVARGLEMQTIAEYVSDDASVSLLREFGVDFAQGFHIGRPEPVSALLDH